jgi:hypothetical protein
MRDAPQSIRFETADTARDAMNRTADEIRAGNYALAYDLLDNLAAKMCRMNRPESREGRAAARREFAQ